MRGSLITKILYQKRWLIFWWFIALTALTALTVIFYPTFKGTNIGQVFNSLPTAVQKITGNGSTFATLNGYISQELFGLRVPLLTAILSIVVFNSLSVGEERKGVTETLISLPITRSKLYFHKLFSALLIILLASVGLFVGVFLAVFFIHDHFSMTRLIQLTTSSVLLGINFGLFTYMLAGIFGVRSIVLGLSCAYAFGSYLITSMAPSVHALVSVNYASLFRYYDYTTVYSTHDTLVLGGTGVVFIIIGFIFFRRRDLAT